MPTLKLTKTELKALTILFADERRIKLLYSNFGVWFPEQMDKVILKIRELSKKYKINSNYWPIAFDNRMTLGKEVKR